MLRRISTTALTLAIAAAQVLIARQSEAQETQDYVIQGISAWSTAKTYGFTFQPLAASGQTVTNPRDGQNTRLMGTQTNLLGLNETVALAQVVGGNASVNRPPSGTRTTTFRFFGDVQLSPGWSVVKVELTGNYVWDRQPNQGSRDLSFQVKASSTTSQTGMAVVSRVTLRGPAKANWADAFAGRKTFTVAGAPAWSTAKQYGFLFQPVKEHDDEVVSAPFNGVDTRLEQKDRRCAASGGAYTIATVNAGNMHLYCPWRNPTHTTYYTTSYDHTRDFLMFGGKRLAPGWVVLDVVVSGSGTWVRRAGIGTDVLEFVYQLASPSYDPVYAIISRVVLEGPSSATSYEDAFKGAITP